MLPVLGGVERERVGGSEGARERGISLLSLREGGRKILALFPRSAEVSGDGPRRPRKSRGPTCAQPDRMTRMGGAYPPPIQAKYPAFPSRSHPVLPFGPNLSPFPSPLSSAPAIAPIPRLRPTPSPF